MNEHPGTYVDPCYYPVMGLAFIFIMCYIIYKLQDAMYNRINKRVKATNVKCPNSGVPLRDFELMHGHCVKCKFHELCRAKIVKAYRDQLGAKEDSDPTTTTGTTK